MKRPRCDCNLECKLAICMVTGGIFWICPVEQCYVVEFTQDRPVANDLDLGQFIPLGKQNIDKYTTGWITRKKMIFKFWIPNHRFVFVFAVFMK